MLELPKRTLNRGELKLIKDSGRLIIIFGLGITLLGILKSIGRPSRYLVG